MTTGIEVRTEPEPADVESVRALVAGTGYFNAEEVAVAAELVAERLERGPRSGYEFLLAERGDKLLGYTCYGLIPCSTVSWDLYWIAVDAGAQGSGIGRHLLRLTEQRVRLAGGLALYAETSGRAQYHRTRTFYHKCGFHVAATFEDFYAVGDPKHVFVKRLDR